MNFVDLYIIDTDIRRNHSLVNAEGNFNKCEFMKMNANEISSPAFAK